MGEELKILFNGITLWVLSIIVCLAIMKIIRIYVEKWLEKKVKKRMEEIKNG